MHAKNVANIPTANVHPRRFVFTKAAKLSAINPTTVVSVVIATAFPVLIKASGTSQVQ